MANPNDPLNSEALESESNENSHSEPANATNTHSTVWSNTSPAVKSNSDDTSSAALALDYGDSNALAWDSAFAHEEKISAPLPVSSDACENTEPCDAESAPQELDELTFGEDPEPEDSQPHSSSAADEEHVPTHVLGDAHPLEEGATFASAYSATGLTNTTHDHSDDETDLAESEKNSTSATPISATKSDKEINNETNDEQVSSTADATQALPSTTHSENISAATPDQTDEWAKDPGEPDLNEVPEKPASRVGAHIGSIFATLILIPIAWYLISDTSIRLSLVENSPWETGHVNILVLVEFVGAMIAVLLLWLMARASSLGAQLWGIVLTLAGLTALVVPKLGAWCIQQADLAIGGYNTFTGNIVDHLNTDLGSGRIALFGFILFLTGLMIHVARKSAARRAEALILYKQAHTEEK